jgi:hypothetical protein
MIQEPPCCTPDPKEVEKGHRQSQINEKKSKTKTYVETPNFNGWYETPDGVTKTSESYEEQKTG